MSNKNIFVIMIIVIIVVVSFMAYIFLLSKTGMDKQYSIENEIDIKNDKETIYELFDNFPESDNIYYISKNLYSKRDIGPTIYQIDILAELTDDGYNNFIKDIKFQNSHDFEMKINPNNIQYNWKEIKNIEIIQSKDVEDASITKIYLDENNKTIYIIALGGN